MNPPQYPKPKDHGDLIRTALYMTLWEQFLEDVSAKLFEDDALVDDAFGWAIYSSGDPNELDPQDPYRIFLLQYRQDPESETLLTGVKFPYARLIMNELLGEFATSDGNYLGTRGLGVEDTSLHSDHQTSINLSGLTLAECDRLLGDEKAHLASNAAVIHVASDGFYLPGGCYNITPPSGVFVPEISEEAAYPFGRDDSANAVADAYYALSRAQTTFGIIGDMEPINRIRTDVHGLW